jgi:hypothetical protein
MIFGIYSFGLRTIGKNRFLYPLTRILWAKSVSIFPNRSHLKHRPRLIYDNFRTDSLDKIFETVKLIKSAIIFIKFMLTHIVCWKYKPEITAEQRAEHIAKLKNLPDVIPNIISFNVGADILHLERSFDTGLVAVYPDREALDFYTDHPDHQAVAALGKQIAEKVVSVDFYS